MVVRSIYVWRSIMKLFSIPMITSSLSYIVAIIYDLPYEVSTAGDKSL